MFLKDFYIQRAQKLQQALSDKDTATTLTLKEFHNQIKSFRKNSIAGTFPKPFWKTQKHIFPL